ncbi:hypothetical protein HOLleu_09484 [Holothuria leucospilota]|uniref:LRAT domain-containing protein n=1 Tax=Holothuria leucospilota TaxID=206669 RepID=A0A9Q1CCX7_HOLLE|nr:hypothetical protein HOLleu_09484 [Holothuria leucospilota]
MKSLTEGQLFILLLFRHGILLVVTLQCQSPQYITLGQQGTIECPFPSQFSTIAWSDSANATATPVIKIESQESTSSKVSGVGFDSGEYDMFSNGSLIIRTPTINTDRTFRVLLVYENASYTDANVVVKTIDEGVPVGGGEFPIIVVIIIVLIILIVVLCCVVYWVRKHMSEKSKREYGAIAKESPEELQKEPKDEEESIEMAKYDKSESADKPEEETSLHSTTNEQEQQNDEVNDYENVPADQNEETPNSEEDCPADETEDPANLNLESPEEEQSTQESRTVMGAALSSWRLKVDHEDKQVDSIEDLAKGDHIVFSGWALHPRCHGIVVDTNIEKNELRLVRFTYQKGVVEEWKKWKPPIYKVLKYYIGDKTLSSNIYDPDVVVERARKMLNNTKLRYNIGMNNCKTFARWCKTDATPAGYGYD